MEPFGKLRTGSMESGRRKKFEVWSHRQFGVEDSSERRRARIMRHRLEPFTFLVGAHIGGDDGRSDASECSFFVIYLKTAHNSVPGKAWIFGADAQRLHWIPAFAGMTSCPRRRASRKITL
jgi:hypothetical protein